VSELPPVNTWASEVFHESLVNRRKVLVVLSDMKQATRALNVERQTELDFAGVIQ
jgi:hypothetical protein